ncbi:MAG: hypothetical protein ABGW50_01640 [Thermococcus sp.]
MTDDRTTFCTSFCNSYCFLYKLFASGIPIAAIPQDLLAPNEATYVDPSCFNSCYALCTRLGQPNTLNAIEHLALPDIGARFVQDFVDIVTPDDINAVNTALKNIANRLVPYIEANARFAEVAKEELRALWEVLFRIMLG